MFKTYLDHKIITTTYNKNVIIKCQNIYNYCKNSTLYKNTLILIIRITNSLYVQIII